jgi:hypothetical protein
MSMNLMDIEISTTPYFFFSRVCDSVMDQVDVMSELALCHRQAHRDIRRAACRRIKRSNDMEDSHLTVSCVEVVRVSLLLGY